jgi:transcriptional regulator
MYSPSFYREERQDLIQQLIADSSFATILTNNKTDLISHLPVILSKDDNGNIELISHFARANPHWRELKESGSVKVIFNGPHSYISPAWYRPVADNVPTWNYAVVHAVGKFEVIDDPIIAFNEMNNLVSHFEKFNETGWELPSDEAAVNDLMKSIVVFKVTNVKFEAKFKLSQKQDPIDRENVIKELSLRPETLNLSQYMKKVMDGNVNKTKL